MIVRRFSLFVLFSFEIISALFCALLSVAPRRTSQQPPPPPLPDEEPKAYDELSPFRPPFNNAFLARYTGPKGISAVFIRGVLVILMLDIYISAKSSDARFDAGGYELPMISTGVEPAGYCRCRRQAVARTSR